jgi:hypothetical protein
MVTVESFLIGQIHLVLRGLEVALDGRTATIVGIAPEGFSFPAPGTELWVPLRLPRDRAPQGGSPYRSFRILDVVGRLRAETSLPEARVRLASLSDRISREYPDSNLGFHLEIEDFREVERGPLRASRGCDRRSRDRVEALDVRLTELISCLPKIVLRLLLKPALGAAAEGLPKANRHLG